MIGVPKTPYILRKWDADFKKPFYSDNLLPSRNCYDENINFHESIFIALSVFYVLYIQCTCIFVYFIYDMQRSMYYILYILQQIMYFIYFIYYM